MSSQDRDFRAAWYPYPLIESQQNRPRWKALSRFIGHLARRLPAGLHARFCSLKDIFCSGIELFLISDRRPAGQDHRKATFPERSSGIPASETISPSQLTPRLANILLRIPNPHVVDEIVLALKLEIHVEHASLHRAPSSR